MIPGDDSAERTMRRLETRCPYLPPLRALLLAAFSIGVAGSAGIRADDCEALPEPRLELLFGRDFDAPGWPETAAVRDLDGDGILDLMVGHLRSDRITIWHGDEGGRFSESGSFLAGLDPRRLVIGDFDGDGKFDVITTGSAAGRDDLSYLRGIDRMTFAAPEALFVDAQVSDLVAEDFDGDGDLDLAAGHQEISILRNIGSGVFEISGTYAAGSGVVRCATVDFDLDGSTDLVSTRLGSRDIGLLFGNGDGSFGRESSYPAGGAALELRVADLDLDGDPDVVVTFDNEAEIGVFVNRGDGTVEAPERIRVAHPPSSIEVGDFDGDLVPDVLVADTIEENLELPTGAPMCSSRSISTVMAPSTWSLASSRVGATERPISSSAIPRWAR